MDETVDIIEQVVNAIDKHMKEWSMSESSVGKVRSFVCKGKYNELMDSINNSKATYGHIGNSDTANEFITKSLRLFTGDQCPVKKKINYAKGIARNRFSYFDEKSFYVKTNFIESTDQAETLIEIVKSSKNWSQFNNRLDEV